LPYYRIILKLEKQPIQEWIKELPDKEIDQVYASYEKRVNEKYGAGRVEYFNCVMVAKKTVVNPIEHKVKYGEPDLTFGLDDLDPGLKWSGKIRKGYEDRDTLGERAR